MRRVRPVEAGYGLEVLPGGVILATAHMPHMASVSLGLWVGIGGRYEPAELNGVSHFIEHLLFKGTRQRTAAQISQAVEGIGGYLNAWTSEENTCFYARARSDGFDVLLDVIGDMFLESVFDPVELEKERGVIQEEVSMYKDQPHQHVQELLNALQWPDQPLGRPLTGTRRSVDQLTRDRILSFHRANYTAPNTLVVAAGNFSAERVRRGVGRLARRLPPGQRSVFPPAHARQQAPVVKLRRRAIEQTQLALGVRTCCRHDERRFALRLLSTVLGENMSSRLFQSLREDAGLAYSVYSSASHFSDAGDFVISAGLDADKLPRALQLILEEMRRLKRRPPSPAEMQRARDYVIGQMDLSLESTESQMTWLGEQVLGYGRIFSPETIRRRLRAVTAADLRRVAEDFFRAERMNLALVGPVESDHGLASLLSSGV